MPVPSAPVISSVTIAPTAISAGTPVVVTVEWTGYPVQGVTYQWRRGTTRIRGETAPTITPTGGWGDLNCFVRIDNGRGTASSASVPADQPPDIPENAMTAGGDPMTAGGDFLTAGD